MAKSARSIATLSLTFGLVSIPVKVYSATESASAIRFRLMSAGGARVRQQYVADAPPVDGGETSSTVEERIDEPAEAPPRGRAPAAATRPPADTVVDFPTRRPAPVADTAIEAPEASGEAVVERSAMVKGYEFEKGRFVLFTPAELAALQEASRQTIDIVSFIPERAVDPIYYDKAYFLVPDRRGARPYHLLLRAMRDTGRSALAKWAFRAREFVVQIRAAEGGMVLQQLLYAEEVRSLADLDIEEAPVGEAELELARRLIAQISEDAYDPTRFVDEEKQRIRAAIEQKIAGRQVVVHGPRAPESSGQVVDLVEALRASLRPPARSGATAKQDASPTLAERKPVKRAAARHAEAAVPAPAPAARKRPVKRQR
jgi:DNA end-binding protein Ku